MADQTVSNIERGNVSYDHAHECSALLFDVLSLIHAVADLNEHGGGMADASGLTDVNSRRTNLLGQAREKTAAAIRRLDV